MAGEATRWVGGCDRATENTLKQRRWRREGTGGGGTQFVHDRSRMAIDRRIPAMP